MDLQAMYLMAYGDSEPFSQKHPSSYFLKALLVANLSKQLISASTIEDNEVVADHLDVLMLKLIENNVSLDTFCDLIVKSQNKDADPYLFTLYGMTNDLFKTYADLYEINPLSLKKFGVKQIPFSEDASETSFTMEFFSLLDYKALKKEILIQENLTKEQKVGLITFIDVMKNKAQYEYDYFDEALVSNKLLKEFIEKPYKVVNSFFKAAKQDDINLMYILAKAKIDSLKEQKQKQAEQAEAKANEQEENQQNEEQTQDSAHKLSYNLKALDKIADHMVGQRCAVGKVIDRISASLVGLRDPLKPLASFLFDGPTGVGKTELAKAIAKVCFNGKMHVEDMSTYKHKGDVSKLTGAAAGYIGYGDEPAIITYLKNNKNGVILFDEIDKCDSECLDFLMRLLDEGEFISSKGEKYSVRNQVIVMTTNMGEYVATKHVGFAEVEDKQKEHAKDLAKNSGFRKEILGRINEIIKFDKLTKEECGEIAKRYLDKHCKMFNKNNKLGITATYNQSLIDMALERADYKTFGGRNVNTVALSMFDKAVVKTLKQNNVQNSHLVVCTEEDVTIEPLQNNETQQEQILENTPIDNLN